MAAPSKIDWVQARDLYVMGEVIDGKRVYPTQEELAKRFGVTPQTVNVHSKSEQWLESRREFQAEIEKQRFQAVVGEIVSASAEFDTTCLDLAGKGIAMVRRHLNTFMKYVELVNRDQGEDELENTLQNMKTLMDPIDLDRLGRALERFQKVGRLAQGQSTENVSKLMEEGDALVAAIGKYEDVFKEIEKGRVA